MMVARKFLCAWSSVTTRNLSAPCAGLIAITLPITLNTPAVTSCTRSLPAMVTGKSSSTAVIVNIKVMGSVLSTPFQTAFSLSGKSLMTRVAVTCVLPSGMRRNFA